MNLVLSWKFLLLFAYSLNFRHSLDVKYSYINLQINKKRRSSIELDIYNSRVFSVRTISKLNPLTIPVVE